AFLKAFQDTTTATRLTALTSVPTETAIRLLQSVRPEWRAEGTWSRRRDPARGDVWSDNPGPGYDNQNVSLTSRSLSLKGMKDSLLTVQVGWELEKDRDKVLLEARSPGKDWQTLGTFSHQGPWQKLQYSLSAFADSEVEVRFRLVTDSSAQKAGFLLGDLALTARAGGSTRTLLTAENGGTREEVLSALEQAADPTLLADFLGRYPSTREGLLAWGSLGANPDPAQATALSQLSKELGTETAALIWSDVKQGPSSLDVRKERALAHHRLADRLCAARGTDDLGVAYEAVKRLDEPGRQALGQLLERAACDTWQPEGTWAYNPAEKGWSTSPGGSNYKSNAKDALTGPQIDLTGSQKTRLRFSASWELEDKYDFVTLTASEDGQNWTELKKFGGNSSWAHQDLDLSAFDGKKVTLRWLLTTDGSTERKGLTFRDLAVTSGDGLPVFRDQPETLGEAAAKLWELVSQGRTDRLQGAAGLPSLPVHQALRLEPVVAQAGPRAEAVRKLIDRVGFQAGLDLAEPVASGRDPDEVAAVLEAARPLAEALGADNPAELTRALLAAGFEPSMAGELTALAGRFRIWEGPTAWQRLPDGTMDDSPGKNYNANENSSLTTRTVDLSGLSSPRLTYEAQHVLENKYDHVHVEVDDGSGWKALATHDGNVGWQGYSRDLNAYKGRQVRLRFRLTSDGSGDAEGMSLRKVSVRGLDAQGREEVRLQDRGAAASESLQIMLRSVLAPGAGGPAVKAALSTLNSLSEGLGDPDRALKVWDAAGGDPDRASDLGLVAAYVGWEESRMLWFVLKDLPADQRTRKAQLLAASARLAQGGLDLVQAQRRLEASDLDSDTLGQLALLATQARTGSWRPEGSWAQVKTPYGTGWADSPEADYLPSQQSALRLPPIDLRGATRPLLRYMATYDTESGRDNIALQASRDGSQWQTLDTLTGSSDWREHSADLSAFADGVVHLRFHLTTDSSVEKEGVTLAGIAVNSDKGEIFRDLGGGEALQGALELACDRTSTLESRRQALETLGKLPDGLGWRALAILREEAAAGRLQGVPMAFLIQRLPEAILSDDLEAALARILKEGTNTGIREEEKAIVVGGVRVKRRQDGTAAGE
ncbi:MAG: hypothetical protein AB1758_21850, partial [Candidatus Eremiobacterota bacterium]